MILKLGDKSYYGWRAGLDARLVCLPEPVLPFRNTPCHVSRKPGKGIVLFNTAAKEGGDRFALDQGA
jgi:hypothetical protein